MSTILTEQDIDNMLESKKTYRDITRHVERVICLKALQRTKGNVFRAAILVGMSRVKFSEVIK
jgi:DNA-binding NtrC family response regulator